MGKVTAADTQAMKLLGKIQTLQDKIAEARKAAKLDAMEAKLAEAKESLVSVMVENEIEQVEGDGCHATLIKQNYGAMFLATQEDVRDAEITDRKLKSMRSIIKKKHGPYKKGSKSSEIWKRITKVTVMQDAVEEVVSEGLLTVEEITPAFVEKSKKPYARIFKDD